MARPGTTTSDPSHTAGTIAVYADPSGSAPECVAAGCAAKPSGSRSGRSSVPYPGAWEGVARLRALGLRLACVTNKPERFAQTLLQAFGPFDALVCGDHVARKKPAPDSVLLACERLGVAPREALFIGDSQNDVDAARAAGCAVWCVPYGYNEGRPATSLTCDRMVQTLEEAAAVISRA